jgi:hypothetical protein
MFPVSLTITNAADLDKVLRALGHTTLGAEAPGKPQPDAKAAPLKPTAAAAQAPKAPKADAPAASTSKPEPQASTEKAATASSAPARAEVSKVAVELALKNKPAITEILAPFGVTGIKALPDEHLATVFAQINAVLAAG